MKNSTNLVNDFETWFLTNHGAKYGSNVSTKWLFDKKNGVYKLSEVQIAYSCWKHLTNEIEKRNSIIAYKMKIIDDFKHVINQTLISATIRQNKKFANDPDPTKHVEDTLFMSFLKIAQIKFRNL